MTPHPDSRVIACIKVNFASRATTLYAFIYLKIMVC